MCTQPITNYSPFLEKSMLNIFWSKKLSQKPINHHRGPTTQHVEDEACLSKCENAFPWEWPLTLLSGWTLWGCPYPGSGITASCHKKCGKMASCPVTSSYPGHCETPLPPIEGWTTLPGLWHTASPDDHCTTPHYMELHIKSQNTPFFSDLWNIWKGGWGVMGVGVAKILKYCKVCKFLLQKYRVFFTLGLPLKVLRTQKLI